MAESHLSSGRINVSLLRDIYRRELLDYLDRCQGTKALVWDNALTGPLGLIAEYTLLKAHEVEKMFPLLPGRLPSSSVKNIVFMVRPVYALMEIIAQNVQKEEAGASSPFKKSFHIVFVPRRSVLCEKKLKDLGVHAAFTSIEEYGVDLFPLDTDVLSMEMDMSFRQCFLDKDMTSLFCASKAIMTLQTLYGIIPNIYGKGECAEKVVDMMMRMRREIAGQELHVVPLIDNLLILDRMVDPLTPLLSQLTYEGLIDEIYGINNTTVHVPSEKFTAAFNEPPTTEPRKLILNSSNELYADLRDRNLNSVGPTLGKRLKLFSAKMDERHTAKIGALKDFVAKLPHMLTEKTAYSNHTALTELVRERTGSDEFRECLTTQQEFINEIGTDKAHSYVEDCIAKREDLVKVLRLICIQSYCNNGLKPKLLDYYKREIIQVYGFEHLVSLHNLETIGLIRTQGVSRNYAVVRKSLKLIVDNVNELNPNDISYVFSGYAPLSVRLAQILHRPGWRSITEVLNLLPGPTTEEFQQVPAWLRTHAARGSRSSGSSGTAPPKVTLIFFLGGVTYAEVAALRFLSQQEDAPTEYIIATTKMINGATLLQSVMDTFTAKPANPF